MSSWKHLSSDCWITAVGDGAAFILGLKKRGETRVMDEYLTDFRVISRLSFELNDRGI